MKYFEYTLFAKSNSTWISVFCFLRPFSMSPSFFSDLELYKHSTLSNSFQTPPPAAQPKLAQLHATATPASGPWTALTPQSPLTLSALTGGCPLPGWQVLLTRRVTATVSAHHRTQVKGRQRSFNTVSLTSKLKHQLSLTTSHPTCSATNPWY